MAYYVTFAHSGEAKLPSRMDGLYGPRHRRRFRGLGQSSPGVPALDPTTGLPVNTMPPPVTSYGPTPSTVFDFGYNPPPSPVAGILGPALSDILLPSSESGESGSGLGIPGSTTGQILANAASGTLTSGQSQAIPQQETAGLIQAGMDPAAAAAQSQSDVNAALTEAGAAPSQAWWNLTDEFGSLTPFSWVLIAGGAAAALIFLVKR